MAKFTVCVSSVIEKEIGFVDYRYTAKSVVERMGHIAVRNPEDVYTQQNFERVLNEECDFFVLIIGNAESEMVERELKIALSRGIPILAFAKITYNKQAKKVLPQKTISTIKQISPELYNMQIVTFFSCEELAIALKNELEGSIDRRLKLAPVIGIDPPIAYSEGLSLIRNAKYRLILSQKTSCLFLGPRKGVSVEQTFYDELVNWIKNERDSSCYFIHYFSIDETLADIKNNSYDLIAAKATLKEFYSNPQISNRITIRASNAFDSLPHVIGDTGIGFNFYVGKNRYYLFLPCFMTKNKELDQIISNVQSAGKLLTWTDIEELYRNAGV